MSCNIQQFFSRKNIDQLYTDNQTHKSSFYILFNLAVCALVYIIFLLELLENSDTQIYCNSWLQNRNQSEKKLQKSQHCFLMCVFAYIKFFLGWNFHQHGSEIQCRSVANRQSWILVRLSPPEHWKKESHSINRESQR